MWLIGRRALLARRAGPPPPPPPTQQTEEEFEAAKAATVQQLVAEAQLAAAPRLPNYLQLERRLTALLDRALPADHPNYAAAQRRLAVLQVRNCGRASALGRVWPGAALCSAVLW